MNRFMINVAAFIISPVVVPTMTDMVRSSMLQSKTNKVYPVLTSFQR